MLALHTSVGCISLQNASRTALCYATNTIKWKTFLIFDINHQQNTREVRPDWNDKNDNANYAPSHVYGRFYQWLRLPFLKKYSIKCEVYFRLWIVLFWTKRHNVYYIYYLATDNIHIVLENDNTVLIKGLKKVVNVKFSRNTHLIETSYDRLKSREITFSAIQGKSC